MTYNDPIRDFLRDRWYKAVEQDLQFASDSSAALLHEAKEPLEGQPQSPGAIEKATASVEWTELATAASTSEEVHAKRN